MNNGHFHSDHPACPCASCKGEKMPDQAAQQQPRYKIAHTPDKFVEAGKRAYEREASSSLYPTHNVEDLGPHYLRHVLAMTSEGLHSKADIAVQLAWRDMEMERLRTIIKESADLFEKSAEPFDAGCVKLREGLKIA